MRLVAAYRWELWLLVVGVACFYPAQAWTAAVTPPGWEWVAFAASWSLPAVGMYLLYGRARRRERGLEFLLIIGIPFAAYLARAVSAAAVPFLAIAIPWFWDYGITGYFLFLALVKIPSPFTAAALLAIGLRYVRRRQRGFLGMAWMMLLAAALLELAVEAYQVAAIQFFPSLNLSALRFGYATLPGFFITAPLTMLLALWFARQASKISLAHAFFIVGLAFAFPVSRLLLEISPNEESDSSLRLAALTVTEDGSRNVFARRGSRHRLAARRLRPARRCVQQARCGGALWNTGGDWSRGGHSPNSGRRRADCPRCSARRRRHYWLGRHARARLPPPRPPTREHFAAGLVRSPRRFRFRTGREALAEHPLDPGLEHA